MGNTDLRHLPFPKTDLKNILQQQNTGTLINLSAASKAAFIKQLHSKVFDSFEVGLLQPEAVSKQLGFLYKPGVLFYEGGVAAENTMKGKGRVSLLAKNITYEGMLEYNQFHGNGVLTYVDQNLVLTGMWERGYPKNIRFGKNEKQSSILIQSWQEQDDNLFKGVIRYWDGMRYEGEFNYDEEKKKFSVTGNGKMYYKNNDCISGHFVDGNLNGQGEFFSIAWGRYKGQFLNGKFNGQGQFFYKDGKVLQSGWQNNKPHGEGLLKINNYTTPVLYDSGKRVLNRDKSEFKHDL